MLKTLPKLGSKGATHVDLPPTKEKLGFTLAEGAMHVDSPPIKVKFGFTLAEVLITLGIIGVVAAITIPNLINNYKAKQLRTQFLKSYSVLSQAFKLMQADDLSTDPRDHGAVGFYNVFARYLNAPTLCNGYIDQNQGVKNSAPAGCYIYKINTKDEDYTGKEYTYLRTNGKINDGLFNNGQIMLTFLMMDQSKKVGKV